MGMYPFTNWTGDLTKGTYVKNPPGAESQNYEFAQGLDAAGSLLGEMVYLPRYQNNVPELKKRCSSLPECRSFNTQGWLKADAVSVGKWTDDPNKGLYYKTEQFINRLFKRK